MQLSGAFGLIEIFVHRRLALKDLARLGIHLEVTTGWGLEDGRGPRGLLLC